MLQPEIGKFIGFDHIVFWVGNAKQAASFYTSRFGFEYYAYQGLETGNREVATHVIKKDRCVFAFCSSYGSFESKETNKMMSDHLVKHGDGVRDVAFEVEDCKKTYEISVSRGAKSVKEPETLQDKNGSVIVASIQTVRLFPR